MNNKYFLHNVIGHPLAGIISLISESWGVWVHDITLPKEHEV